MEEDTVRQTNKGDVGFPKQKEKKSRKKLLIIPVVLLLLGLVGIGYFLLTEPAINNEDLIPTPTESQRETPTPTEEPVNKSELTVNILNGTGIAGAAGDLQDEFEAIGFTDIEVGNADDDSNESAEVTFSGRVPQSLRDEIVDLLEGVYDDVNVGTGSSSGFDIEVITGLPANYQSPTPRPQATTAPSPTTGSTAAPSPTSSPSPTPTP